MAFPEDSLGVMTELSIGGVMTDVTEHAMTRNLITHSRGQTAEGQATDPASCSLTLKSPNGLYSPRNPRSPYYQQIGRNTPMRVSVHAGNPYLAVDGTQSGATTPDAASLDVTGDLDIRLDAQLDDWTLPADLIGKWGFPDQKSWMLLLFGQRLWFYHTTDGSTETNAVSTTTVPVAAFDRIAVRVTLDVDNGAAGRTVTFYTAPTIAGPWTQLGTPVVTAGTTSIFSGAGSLFVGAISTVSNPDPIGRLHAAEVRNGINGTVVASPDFTTQTPGAASFVDSAGRTWTVSGSASITNKQIRFVGEFSDWPAEWSGRGDLIVVEGDGAGLLERMSQGTKVLASTLRRRIPSYNPVAYWPMEEGSDATTVYSPIPGVKSFTPTALQFAGDDTLPGSSPLPVVQVGASFVARVPAVAAGTWQVELVYNLDTMPAAETTLFEVRTTGTARRVRARVATNLVRIDGLDADDNTVFTNVTTAPQFTGAWNRLQIKAVQSGGNVQYVFRWVVIGGTGFSVNITVAATPGYVIDVRSSFGTGLDGLRFGHLAVFNTESDQPFNSADQGFNGETAADRMVRLCEEEGVTFRAVGVLSESMQMGPQRPGTLLSLLQLCADADGGIFGEERDRLGLRYRTRTSLYNQTPALTLSYATRGLGLGRPVDDTSTVRNDITVNRVAGGSARAVLEEGRLSVQDPPDGVGLYDEGVDLNLFSDDLTEPSAFWRLHLGTWDEARYPSVTLRLHRIPSLIPTVLDLTEGDLIRITDLPEFLPPGPIDLLVQGYTERFGTHTWEIDLVCVPGGPYSVAALSDPALEWVDTDGTELATAATDTATTIDIMATDGPVWRPDPSETPFDLMIAGEEVRVAAGGRLINPNPWFDTDTTGWLASNGTIARSTAVVHPQAEASLLITPNGSSASGGADLTPRTPVGSIIPGASYIASCWVYSPGGWSDLRACIDWYDSANAFISSGLGSASVVPAGQWTFLQQTLTAPANASRAAVRARHGGTPAASAVWYVWGLRITQTKASTLHDAFGRTAASGWGTSDAGVAWTTSGGSASDYAVGSGYGSHTLTSTGTSRRAFATAVSADCDIYCSVATDQLATGTASLYAGLMARHVDVNNLYSARVEFTTGQAVILSLLKRIAGVETQLDTFTTTLTHAAGTFYRMRFKVTGSDLRARIWAVTSTEPGTWHVDAVDTDFTAAQSWGIRSITFTGNTNVNPQIRYDDFDLINPQILTVERSRNGVRKAQALGEDVRLAYPARVAL